MRAALAAGLVLLVSGCAVAEEDTPPEATASVPRATESAMHEALHRLDRLCRRPEVNGAALRLITTTALDLHRRYPVDRRYTLQIDDEQGTSLSVLLVVRDTLRTCDARQAARIDAVLPNRIRRALRPLDR